VIEDRCVMVVDDEPGVRGVLSSMLQRAGYEVHTAADAEEALRLFHSLEVDAVITDVRMPGKDGVELLEELHEMRADLPVLLVTGFGTIDGAVQAMKLGATDYITKPFKRGRLLAALERALERARAAAEPAAGGDGGSVAEMTLEAALERRMTLREVGDLYIERVLELARGNKCQAARALGINRRTLYRRGAGTGRERDPQDAN
jgi:DNA-binding NtrC family response regulator